MQQLVLDLARPAPQTFASFRTGRNAEAVALLRELADHGAGGKNAYIWGAEGSGKTHLLRAATAAAAPGRSAYVDLSIAPFDSNAAHTGVPAARVDLRNVSADYLLALDHVDQASDQAQGAAFTLFNRIREAGGSVIAAGRFPVSRLPLRDDLRTRLGWGPSLEVVPLTDEEKCDALLDAAAHRGIGLPTDVARYLLRHGPRDLGSLLAILADADRLSLAERRPLTVPLLRGFLHKDEASLLSGL